MAKDFKLTPVKKKLDSSKNDEYRELEKTLWEAADKLRSNMDAAEYKHVVLGLIFLKYVSDSFNRVYERLQQEEFADPEHPDEYRAENVFWVPMEARWETLQKRAKEHEVIGQLIDQSMDAIERDNPKLRGVLSRNYARPELDKQRLGELIDLISSVGFGQSREEGLDIIGRVYEYFIGKFADAEGKKGGQFYTPRSIVRLLVEMIEPYKGRVFDPCCGSGGMFIQSKDFVAAHQGKIGDIWILGQESNNTTWRLCMMNLAIRGIDGNIKWGDSFTDDQHKDLKADFILANPPFNDSDWRGDQLRDDVRWQYGIPPVSNANYAWIQHFIYHLAPHGVAGFVMANGSLASPKSADVEIRKNIVEADLVDCIITLPNQLFYNTPIAACLWFIARDKSNDRFRDRRGQTLCIDARKFGVMIDRRHRELTFEDIRKITKTYHAWRDKSNNQYQDIKGYSKSVTIEEICEQEHILTPGRYVGIEYINEGDESWDEKYDKIKSRYILINELSKVMDEEIRDNLNGFEYMLKESKTRSISLKDTILGKIPENWKVVDLETVVDVIDCLHNKKPEQELNGNILLQVYNIGEYGLLNLDDVYRVTDDDYNEWTKKIELKEGDCVISKTGRVGAIAQIPSDFNAGMGRNLVALRPVKIPPSYLIEYLLSQIGKNEINRLALSGTILHSIHVKYIKKIKVILPDQEALNKFEEVIHPIRAKMLALNKEIKSLSELRGILLPQLIMRKKSENI